jgi:hypothetical protein
MTTNYLKRYYGQPMEVNEDVTDRIQDGLTVSRKTQRNWVVEIGGLVSRTEVAGDICWRGPRPTQVCRADYDDDDNNNVAVSVRNKRV